MSVLDHPLPTKQAQAMLKALADPLRLQLVHSLARNEQCVCELTEALGQAQSKLSFHIKVLKEAGLILDRQEGRWIHYRLNPIAFKVLEDWLCDLSRICQSTGQLCSLPHESARSQPPVATDALAS
ncbi:MAG: ArsR/SmtB family transcription factor [Cyanobacteriota bacterium]